LHAPPRSLLTFAQDLFRHERVTILDEHGNYVEKVIKPEPLINPITLLRMLTWKNWLFFLVGLAAWTVDGYDCECMRPPIRAYSPCSSPLGLVVDHQSVQVLWSVQD
jgi:hypothetical protein